MHSLLRERVMIPFYVLFCISYIYAAYTANSLAWVVYYASGEMFFFKWRDQIRMYKIRKIDIKFHMRGSLRNLGIGTYREEL